jgi:UDP-GlcNAc:undecaprenyl-phosphate GlcNAc-1-phosphate transferase
VTNAVNLSDGLDGLAGGIIILAFLCLSYISYTLGMISMLVISLSVVGAVFGFLRYNMHPASVFMGDLGSQLLGFLAITLSTHLCQNKTALFAMGHGIQGISPLFPLLILGLPVLDTLTVMTRRILKGQAPFAADKTHFHHRLMHLGLSHGQAVVTIIMVQFMMVLTAFSLRYHSDRVILFSYFIISTAISGFFYVSPRIKRYRASGQNGYETLMNRIFWFKEKHPVIKPIFRALFHGLTLFIILLFMIPKFLPVYMMYTLIGTLVVHFLAKLIYKNYTVSMVAVGFYSAIPFVLFSIDLNIHDVMDTKMVMVYRAFYFALAILTVLTLKFTRRQGRYAKHTCFLMLFCCMILMAVHLFNIQNIMMIKWVTHVLILSLAFNVVRTETRREKLALSTELITMFFISLFSGKGH